MNHTDTRLDGDLLDLGSSRPELAEDARHRLEARGPAIVPDLVRELTADRLGDAGLGRVLALLAAYSTPQVEDALLRALGHRRFAVRVEALGALSTFPGRRVTEAIAACLSDQDGDFALQAALRLASRKDAEAALPRLLTMLESRDVRLRRIAVSALGRIPKEPAARALAAHLEREPDPEIRSAIARLCPRSP